MRWWLLGVLASGCVGGVNGASSTDGGLPASGDPPGPAPVLGATHLGWKSQHCDGCHDLPVAGHSTTSSPSCASCHGANGACDPNGQHVAQAHAQSDDCVGCHATEHGFTGSSECTSCHYETKGTRDCSAESSTAPGALASNCFGWPEQEFGTNGVAGVGTALAVGDPAVDFTLKDTLGVDHTLSDLLATKPVALVFGAFT